jgi:energy-coupling factor transporter ATP-binding protein EcfA2
MTTCRRNALQLESVPWGAQFGQYVMEHAAAFTPRDWVVSAIQDWLSDHSGTRFLLLTGQPGSGKTALMAQLALLSAGTAAGHCPKVSELMGPGV